MRMMIVSSALFLGFVASACGDDDGDTGSEVDGGGDGDIDAGAGAPATAASYINRDNGMPTENLDVNMDSSCGNPDREDDQALSDEGMVNRNVHNDACLFDSSGTSVDAPATFETTGVGFVSACPDPDGEGGPKTATASDTNGDTLNDRCVVGGYQATGMAGDGEYHARFNNDTTAGTQTVVFCFDANGNGCADETVTDTLTIDWTAE